MDHESDISRKVEDLSSSNTTGNWRMSAASFAEFKWRVEQLDEDNDLQPPRDHAAIEASGNDLMQAVKSCWPPFVRPNKGRKLDGATSTVL